MTSAAALQVLVLQLAAGVCTSLRAGSERGSVTIEKLLSAAAVIAMIVIVAAAIKHGPPPVGPLNLR